MTDPQLLADLRFLQRVGTLLPLRGVHQNKHFGFFGLIHTALIFPRPGIEVRGRTAYRKPYRPTPQHLEHLRAHGGLLYLGNDTKVEVHRRTAEHCRTVILARGLTTHHDQCDLRLTFRKFTYLDAYLLVVDTHEWGGQCYLKSQRCRQLQLELPHQLHHHWQRWERAALAWVAQVAQPA